MRVEGLWVGSEQTIDGPDRSFVTGIVKAPSPQVGVTLAGVVGDTISDTEHHGGPDQAVYLYGADDYERFEMPVGRFGENVTISTLGDAVCIGDRYRLGDVEVEVTATRIPCAKLSARVGRPAFIAAFRAARCPGAYTRVLATGHIAIGDDVERTPGPFAVGLVDVFDAYYDVDTDPDALRRILDAPIAERFRGLFERRLGRLTA